MVYPNLTAPVAMLELLSRESPKMKTWQLYLIPFLIPRVKLTINLFFLIYFLISSIYCVPLLMEWYWLNYLSFCFLLISLLSVPYFVCLFVFPQCCHHVAPGMMFLKYTFDLSVGSHSCQSKVHIL